MRLGRIAQGSMFIIASTLLFLVNYNNNSTLGMSASSLFLIGNILGLYLFIKKNI